MRESLWGVAEVYAEAGEARKQRELAMAQNLATALRGHPAVEDATALMIDETHAGVRTRLHPGQTHAAVNSAVQEVFSLVVIESRFNFIRLAAYEDGLQACASQMTMLHRDPADLISSHEAGQELEVFAERKGVSKEKKRL